MVKPCYLKVYAETSRFVVDDLYEAGVSGVIGMWTLPGQRHTILFAFPSEKLAKKACVNIQVHSIHTSRVVPAPGLRLSQRAASRDKGYGTFWRISFQRDNHRS